MGQCDACGEVGRTHECDTCGGEHCLVHHPRDRHDCAGLAVEDEDDGPGVVVLAVITLAVLVIGVVTGLTVAEVTDLGGEPSAPAADTDPMRADDPGDDVGRDPGTVGRDEPETRQPATAAVRNPWRESPVVVAIEGGGERSVRPLVAETIAFWERNDGRYAQYEADFELRPNATDPDVVVSFVDGEVECDGGHGLGCAPLLGPRTLAERPTDVRIAGDFTNESTLRTMKHEFGHVLGIRHGEPPRPLMRAVEANAQRRPLPDASARPNPWRTTDLTVYLDNATAAERQQIDNAFGFFTDGADGTVPAGIGFEYTDNRSAADIVVRIRNASACDGRQQASCGVVNGPDPDRDGAIEYYTRLRVTVSGVGTDAVAWHAGRWLAYGFGADETADFPTVLRSNRTYRERRDDWWS
ncbi:hypothetical protein BRD17_05000 [Halobacteriales archaeon SW_7_68_16]|nr:MAG: hypothetical protein BRD17_05000 [Halobacteriales archaeon SW_7_68_16]